MSAFLLATQTANITRSPAVSGGKVGPQVSHLTGLAMVPPMPVSSETFLAHPAHLRSPRKQWETFIFPTDDGGTASLPDVDGGDGLTWTEESRDYVIKGLARWDRGDSGLLTGRAFLHLLIEEVQIT